MPRRPANPPAQSEGQQALDGLEAPDRISIVGARLDVDGARELGLGESVEFTVKGHVIVVGDEALEKEGRRHFVKVRADLIQLR